MARNFIAAAALLAALLLAPLADAQRGRKSGSPPPSGQGQAQPPSGEDRGPYMGGGKRKHSGDWLRRYSQLPPAQQEKELNKDPEFQKLPEPQQQRLRNRLRWFNELPPERRQKIIDRMDRFGHMTPAQQERARVLFDRSRQLPPERQRAVRRTFNRLQEMPRDQRQRELQSERYRTAFTPAERALIDDMLHLADEVEETNTGE